MASDRIGFIGLGSMGGSMAERLLDAGMPLTVCDTNAANLSNFRQRGATIAATPREVADKAEVVLACLPSTAVSLAVALGPTGVVHGTAVRVYVETSTIGMKTVASIAAGLAPAIGVVDSPVSGGPPGARAGTLSTMSAGAREDFERARPVLTTMAKNVFYLGAKPGVAQIAKLINNHLSAAGRLAAFEGLVMALKAGLDPRALLEVINKSSGRNYTTTDKIEAAILSGTFTFNGLLANSVKDQTLLAEQARDLDMPLWVAPKLLETLKAAAGAGYLEKDSMLLIQFMGEQAGIDVRSMMEASKSVETRSVSSPPDTVPALEDV